MNWTGPAPMHCDICSTAITTEFFDARTRQGPWGNLCKACWELHTDMSLGIGHGQHYQRTSANQGQFTKVE